MTDVLRSTARVLFLVVASIAGAGMAWAHEVRPAYLELRQVGDEDWEVRWKVPARGDQRLAIQPRISSPCTESPRTQESTATGILEHWRIRCAGGLAGRTIEIEGLPATYIDVLARVEHRGGGVQTARLRPESPAFVIEAAPHGWRVAGTYFALGVEHILLGIDHLLFVAALLLITGGGWRLVKTVTAFTLAHSITLALATLGFVHVPPAPVEAVIALSIVFVAAEIVHTHAGRPGVTARAPWIVAFVFGLLHGFGFAGALSEIGLPANHIPLALSCFNLGVEAGQLAFVGVVLAAWKGLGRLRLRLPGWAVIAPAYAIGGIAMFWVIERVLSF